MIAGIQAVPEPQSTLSLLRRLCFGAGERLVESSRPFQQLQQLGFAEVEKIEGKKPLVIKSKLIRQLALKYVLEKNPAFVNVPMQKEDPTKVDIPSLLVESIRHFVPGKISQAYTLEAKDHETKRMLRVPCESAYHTELRTTIAEAFRSLPRWKLESEAKGGGQSADDILLSTNPDPTLGVDQKGDDTLIPIYHVLHDEKFQQVRLFYAPNPSDKKPTVATILGQNFKGVSGEVVEATKADLERVKK